MNEANQNPDAGQVQTPASGATDELAEYAKMKPDEIKSLVENSKAAIAAATQRNQEAADERRRLDQERDYIRQENQRLADETRRAYDQLQQFSQIGRQAEPVMPKVTDLTPEDAFKLTWQETQNVKRLLEDERKANAERERKLTEKIDATQRAVAYQRFLEKDIYPNYSEVQEADIDKWFSRHPGTVADEQSVHAAAKEIQGAFDSKVQSAVEARLKAKAESDAKAQGLGGAANATIGALPDGKSALDMSEDEQRKLLYNDIKRFTGQ